MTLGDVIKRYRTNNKISMDIFSELSGISKAYISLLEKNRHPKTGKPIVPSIQVIKQAANAMNIDFNELFSLIDSDVSLENNQLEEITLTTKDSREISSILANTEELLQQEGLMFYGEPASRESIDSILSAMKVGMELAKQNNKKYTPNKHKKD